MGVTDMSQQLYAQSTYLPPSQILSLVGQPTGCILLCILSGKLTLIE